MAGSLKYKFIALAALQAVGSYAKEFIYHMRAKASPGGTGSALLHIRKRTHHLERYLFSPSSYPIGFGEKMAAELEGFIKEAGDTMPARQLAWTNKVLAEYHGISGACGCEMINDGVCPPAPAVEEAKLMRLLRARRTRRIWLNEPLTTAEREKITEAALLAPSSCNRQTLHLVFVEDQPLKEFVASTIGGGHQFFAEAPAIAVIVSDARDYRYPDDRTVPFAETGAAIQNIYLLCETMGLGCCWASYTSFGAAQRENEVREKLNLPPSFIITGAVALGKSKQFVCMIPRDEPSKRLHIDRFNQGAAE